MWFTALQRFIVKVEDRKQGYTAAVHGNFTSSLQFWTFLKRLWREAWTSAAESTQRMTDFISYQCAFFSFFSFFPPSAAKEWRIVCSLSLLLAWKGISKLLWLMLALSPLSTARLWILAHAKTQTERGLAVDDGDSGTLILNGQDGHAHFGCSWRWCYYYYGPRPKGCLKKIDSSWAPLARGTGRETDKLNLWASSQWQDVLYSFLDFTFLW